MTKKSLDGKTYYYLLDDNNLLHVCSGGKTVCGLDASKFNQVSDARLVKYKTCPNCTEEQATKSSKVTKSAKFETKAEIVEVEPATGKII